MRTGMVLSLAVLYAVAAWGQVIYHDTPDWISTDSAVSTGGALVDLNHDGWLDFVVSNGNDMAQQRVAVYYNQGNGHFPATPNWQSSNVGYHGHLDVADVDGDGWEDVAVAYLGEFNSTGPIARLYRNVNGTLTSTPIWQANINGNAFGVAFGDMNNDGRPDLAVATGWAYDPQHNFRNYVYLNVNGVLSSLPSWTSADLNHYQGACWVDADGDGWLDLAFAASRTTSRLYRNLGGMLSTTTNWAEGDVATQDAIMVTAGDVNSDGVPDLFMADNNQLYGSGTFRQYDGQAGALFETTASWDYYDGYCSAVALADLNADGCLDLIAGGWWLPARIFLNYEGTGFFGAADWSSNTDSVIEKICFGDIDRNGTRPVQEVFAPIPSGRRLFQLPHQPIQKVVAVAADGAPLSAAQYVLNWEHGWLTVGMDVANELVVDYTVSTSLEMAITTWDSGVGNYVFYNQTFVPGDANCDGHVDFDDVNPFVMLITGTYPQEFPECNGPISCDLNGDEVVDFSDINPFVDLLSGS